MKGSRPCISRLIDAGAELDVKEENGKTPAEMAKELKAEEPWKSALLDAGLTETGKKNTRSLSKVCFWMLSRNILSQAYIRRVFAPAGERNHIGLDTADCLLWFLLFCSCSSARLQRYPTRSGNVIPATSRMSIVGFGCIHASSRYWNI